MANELTLAVAGGRKTQGLIDYCASLSENQRVLVLTFTRNNQDEIKRRLSKTVGHKQCVNVMGWYTFLIRDFVKPFIPFKFYGERVRGFNFEGRPYRMASGKSRFLDKQNALYASELARLSFELIAESHGSLMTRLESIYDEILIDEVQDLSGYDFEILDCLLKSLIKVKMVGDIRQAVLSTNPRAAKNKRYAYSQAMHWFTQRQSAGLLNITHQSVTWRCHSHIAQFSDSIFHEEWGFPKTTSRNNASTGHDGVFLLRPDQLDEYIRIFSPTCLRDSIRSGKEYAIDFINFRLAKGMSFQRVLILPTSGIVNFLQNGTLLEPLAACKFYVAVTRAEQSVAILASNVTGPSLDYWDGKS
jgi:superfamily I DNA/RNA helicase